MSTRITTLLILITLTWAIPSQSYADDASIHFAAHFGTSFAINALFYGIAKQAFRANPLPAFLFGAITTLMIGFVYKFSELQPGNSYGASTIPRAMLENAAGCTAFGASIVMFKF